jgi:Flp pilus assembly protein TadD
MLLGGCGGGGETPIERAVTAARAYVGSAACQDCHADEYAAWHASHHRLAMQPATDETVAGDFSGTSYDYAGTTYEFFTRDGHYRVRADDEDGELREFGISHTFGIEPLQQYLVPFPDGRRQALGVAWDTRPAAEDGQRWFHVYPDEAVTRGDELHWSGRNQNWNYMCADCHSTDVHKNYDPATDTYATSWAEVTVGCEACHGPASMHVAAAGSDDYTDSGLTPALGTQSGQVDTCARCHARRGILAEGFEPGAAFLDYYRPALLEDGLYHADGQILGEVYVYGSFLQSKMYQRGVRCTDCHDPHRGDLNVTGNGTCTACHRADPPARFPTLKAKVYDDPDHHFHEPGSAGAQCVNCHMPSLTYMVVDDRRDHSFRLPRPDLSPVTGAPNACNGCHTDRDAEWAAAEIEQRYPGSRPPQYGEAIAAGRRHAAGAADRLVALAGRDDTPAIVAATALSLLQGYSGAPVSSALEAGLHDSEPLVRLGALRGTAGLDAGQGWALANQLLEDELLAVRSEAAVTLAPTLERDLRQADRERLLAALRDYVATQRLNADRPEAQTNLGNIYARTGLDDDAEAAYRRALELDPAWVPAMVNVADFYRARSRDAEAGEMLERARQLAPANAAVRHAYGLLLVREGRAGEALGELEAAAELNPENPRYRFVYGIALNSTGRSDDAVAVLESARESFPDDADILFALATIERDRGNTAAALEYVEALLRLQPGDPQWLALQRQLSRETPGGQ